MIKIKVTTEQLTVECSDEFVFAEGYSRHDVPNIIDAVKRIINEAVDASLKIRLTDV